MGTTLLILAAALGDWRLLVAAPIVGYAFAWIGHFGLEATSRRPSAIPCGRSSATSDARAGAAADWAPSCGGYVRYLDPARQRRQP